ncbi:hypothetical protein AB6A40_000869 [Gnathostoma spinigerum]|uniref:Hexosyltransferase n=1 Tax=Gnathostoma spinigerum TaxID=75299 RepID=A0ABD6ECX2_9BILA
MISLFRSLWWPTRLRHIYLLIRYPLLLYLIFMTVWLTGVLDYIFAVPFDEFRWPPYIDVKREVQLDLAGELPRYMYENDWLYFPTPLIRPECVHNESIYRDNYLLIVIKSAVQNSKNRFYIRRTWCDVKSVMGYRVRCIFIVGRDESNNPSVGLDIQGEASAYGDVLLANFSDSYRNNTLKFLTAIQQAHDYCAREKKPVGSGVPYAFFVDDDYIVILRNLIKLIRSRSPDRSLYMGWRFDSAPLRLWFEKNRLTYKEYPFDRLPPYISAGAVIMSRRTIRDMYYAIRYVRLFKMDDVYAGIVAKLMDILAEHNENMRYWYAPIDQNDTETLICAHGYAAEKLGEVFLPLFQN